MVKDGEMRRGITLERVNSLVGPKAITNSRLTKEPRTKERKGRGHRVGREIQGDRKGKISRLIGEREIEKKRDGERERGRTKNGKRDLFPRYVGASRFDCTHGQFRTTLIDFAIERRGHETRYQKFRWIRVDKNFE